jgi:HlyD family secretion protein
MSTEAPSLAPVARTSAVVPAPSSRALVPLGRRELGSVLPPYPPNLLLDAPAPRTRMPLIFGLVIFLVFVVGFGAWAGLAPLAEAAIAPGVIKVEGNRRTIQHLEGGIVREILVRDGTKVEAGQVLMRLDDIQSDATLETQRAQRWALLAQDARLSAEMARAQEISFPADLLGSPLPRAMDAVTGQRALFEARTASLNSQVQVLQARIDQQQAAIAGARGQLAATRQQLAFIRQEETMRRGLVQQGLGRLPELLAVQRARAGLEGSIEELNGQVERANATIAEAGKQIQQLVDQRMQEVSTELRDVRGKLAETEERLRAASDVQSRRDILAPEAGTVLNLRIFTLGAVVKPGDPVMDLVPENDRLVAEVNIQPMDIDVVYPGLRTEIRLPAFKQRLVPFLHGHVTWVAADVTTNEQTRQQYYRAYVLIDRDQLERLPNIFLTPGMPVEAHVQIGERTFFRYITQPIRDSFHRAFREQ